MKINQNEIPNIEQQLLDMAEKYLNEEGKTDVQIHIADGEIGAAKKYLLGAVDRLWQNGGISDEEAREAYAIIGISPEDASQIRQKSGKWS